MIGTVPTSPTTTLAAMLASIAASRIAAPAARQAARVPITVSPAPVTSNTCRATAGMWKQAPRPRSTSVIPSSPRVIRTAFDRPARRSSLPASQTSRSVASSRPPRAACASPLFGVMTVHPR